MIVATTPEQFESAIAKKGTVGYINIRRKMSSTDLHSGHLSLINYSKNNYDLTAVAMTDFYEMVYAIYGYKRAKVAKDGLKNWVRNECIEWLQNNSVDVLYLLYDGFFIDWYNNNRKLVENTKKWVDKIWVENNYPIYEEYGAEQELWMITAKSAMVYYYLEKHFGTYQITTWKNGDIVFIYDHFTKTYIPENNFVIIDPTKNKDDIYYSTSYGNISPTQKSVISQFENVVKNVGYNDKELLKIELQKLNIQGKYSIRLEITDITITDNHLVGSDKIFININFKMGENICNHPLYLNKGDFNAESKI